MIRRTSIAAGQAQAGDILDTFQQGRITVKAITSDGPHHMVITTTRGRTWRTSRTQLVGRISLP